MTWIIISLFLSLAILAPTANGSTSSCGYKACPRGDPQMINVHIVPHTHMDVGWLKTKDQYYYGSKQRLQRAGVQYIITSVVNALRNNPDRKFVLVESSFIAQWWERQPDSIRSLVLDYVNSGRLEFAGGGWSMNDEACPSYSAIIDNMSWGLRFLRETFGECGVPKVAWQIDPFGHSKEQASLFAQMYYDGIFMGRIDYQEKNMRETNRTMEMIWKASNNLGNASHLFAGVLPNAYSPPANFCFDILCGDDPIIDDPSLPDYNVPSRVQEFLQIIDTQRELYKSNNLVITMGNDFNYQDADAWFINLDRLIKHVNAKQSDGSRVNLFYSTPACYLYNLNLAGESWPTKSDDFLPYSSDPHAFWTGYYTSRPAFKGYVREANAFSQVTKQLFVLTSLGSPYLPQLDKLRSASGVTQHHDAITGTAKQEVDDDYRRQLADGISSGQEIVAEALARLMKKDSTPPPTMVFCNLLNISQCNVTMNEKEFTITLYNPLGSEIQTFVRLPVSSSDLAVHDNDGNPVTAQTIPVHPGLLNAIGKKGPQVMFELVFSVSVPPVGFRTYFVTISNNIIPQHTYKSKIIDHQDTTHDIVISNEFLEATVDGYTGCLKEVYNIKDNIFTGVNQGFYWYRAMDGDNRSNQRRASGAYIFRPNGSSPVPITKAAYVVMVKGPVVSEVHQVFSPWLSQVIRVYNNSFLIELDWIVGPIPKTEYIGKEVISRFDTSLKTDGVFYTDANGREIQRRVRNHRGSFEPKLEEPISGNYYPVNSRIFIKDVRKNAQVTIFTDRTQGGSSLVDGSMELMVHRRLFLDDGFGVGEPLNEPGTDGRGLVVRGFHYLTLTPADGPESSLHRQLARQLLFQSTLVFSALPPELHFPVYKEHFHTEKSGLRTGGLPPNVNLLTLEPWTNGTILLRLEHLYEEKDEPQSLASPVTIDMKDLFSTLRIESIKETTLGANQFLDAAKRLQWPTREDDHKCSTKVNRSDLSDSTITLHPMQIRTFLISTKNSGF